MLTDAELPLSLLNYNYCYGFLGRPKTPNVQTKANRRVGLVASKYGESRGHNSLRFVCFCIGEYILDDSALR